MNHFYFHPQSAIVYMVHVMMVLQAMDNVIVIEAGQVNFATSVIVFLVVSNMHNKISIVLCEDEDSTRWLGFLFFFFFFCSQHERSLDQYLSRPLMDLIWGCKMVNRCHPIYRSISEYQSCLSSYGKVEVAHLKIASCKEDC